jgi:hypothetical protein
MRGICGRRGNTPATGRKLVAWLALFSLFLQLWITAGHFHPEDFATLYGRDAAEAVLVAPSDDNGSVPSGLAVHDDCALCLSVQLAGNSTLPAASMLAPPADRPYRPATIVRTFHLTTPPHLLFETRAPPVV